MSEYMPKLRACRTCGNQLPLDSEHFRFRKSSGGGFLDADCRVCERRKGLERYYAKTGRVPPQPLPDPPAGMKRCTKCQKIKAADSDTFTTRGGELDSWCRACNRAGNAENNRRNPFPARKRVTEWRERNPERYKQFRRAYYEKNRERIRANDAAYYESNREKRSAYAKRWYATPRGMALAKAGAARRRARLMKAKGTHTSADIQSRYKLQGGKCYWCGTAVRFGEHHVDHVHPLSKGGSNGPENICIACPPCNRKKYDKTPLEFAGRLF